MAAENVSRTKMAALPAFLMMLDEQRHCDVKFCIEGNVVGAHRAFLEARSDVLFELTESWTPKDEPIAIQDLSYETFHALLR